jgi:VWFA-related protein
MVITQSVSTLLLVLALVSPSVGMKQQNGSQSQPPPQGQQPRGRNGPARSQPAEADLPPTPAPPRLQTASPVGGGPVRGGDDGPVKLGVDLVVLDALVLHQKTGRAVGDLKREDFQLQEDGLAQEIANFDQDTLPLSVIFLVDRGGCLDPFSEKVRRATQDALARLKPQDEAALMAFADRTDLIADFTTRREPIIRGLERIPAHNEEAQHCFSDAFYRAADYMRRAGNPDGRRVIVVITAITTHWDCGRYSTEDARQMLLESGSVVCAIIPKTAIQRMENGIMRAATSLGRFKSKTDLKQIIDETGGEMLTDKPDALDQTFGVLMDHLRTRYTLGFVSTNANRDGGFRKLKLEVKQRGTGSDDRLVVKTRRGYLARRGGR